MTREDVIKRIQKLLRLGESPSEHEAAAAIAKAQALMETHRIEEAMLDTESDEANEEVREWEEPINAQRCYWRGSLAVVLCKANGCFVWRKHGTGDVIVGKASNVQTVRYLFGYCVREIDRLARAKGKGNGRTWTNNYRIGCVQGISAAIEVERTRVREEIRRTYAETQKVPNHRALVKVENAIEKVDAEATGAETFARSKRKLGKQTSRFYTHHGARAIGRRDGQSIYPGQHTKLPGTKPKEIDA